MPLPLFSAHANDLKDGLGLLETANKVAELNTQILNQFIPPSANTVNPSLTPQPSSLIAAQPNRSQAEFEEGKKSVLDRFASAVIDIFKVK